MKKGILLGLASLFLLTGCGNKVVCSGKVNENGLKVDMKVTATFKNDKVNKLSGEIAFDDKDTAEQYCSLFKLANNYADEKDKISFKCSGKVIAFDDFNDFLGDEHEYNKMSKKEFIKSMEESDGVSCK